MNENRSPQVTEHPVADAIDFDRLETVRMVLSEYDIVATGIKTLCARIALLSRPDLVDILDKLRTLEINLCLDRESLWRVQVSDKVLNDVVIDLAASENADPFADLSAHLERVKRALIPLANALETLSSRRNDECGEITSCGHESAKQHNLERVAYEVAFGRTRLSSAPLRQLLDSTSRCNLRCLTCHQSATQDVIHYDLADSSLATLESAMKLAKQVFIAGMGEPLLSRSIFDLVSMAKASGAYVEAITNGTTLGRGWKLLPMVDCLMVSIDGGTAESYEAIRRNGNFDRLIASIRELSKEERRKLVISAVVSKQNIFTMPALVALSIELNVGQIHLHEMGGYLPWHDRMLIDEVERSWLFKRLPELQDAASHARIELVCNLVPPRPGSDGDTDPVTATKRSLLATADVPVAAIPPRLTLFDIAAELQSLIHEKPPAAFSALAAAARKLGKQTESEPIADSESLDWDSLRKHVESGRATMPHCMTTYAHLIVNGDATTRSCCTVQNRLASTEAPTFDQIWNSDPYVEMRTAHAAQIAPRKACAGCRDPVRFHFLPQVLEVLDVHDIDVSLIRKPNDFPLPASIAEHPLVRKLTSAEPSIK